MNYKTINDMREAGMGWQAIAETLQAQRNDALEQLNRARDDYETAMHSLGTSHEDYEDAMRALDQMEADRNRLRELLKDAADSIIAEGQRKAEAVTVSYDLSPAAVDGAICDKLVEMGWTPPGEAKANEPADSLSDKAENLCIFLATNGVSGAAIPVIDELLAAVNEYNGSKGEA